jgi:DNA recombination-dependent growth factor C
MGIHSGSITLARYRFLGGKNVSLAKLNKELPRYQGKKIRLKGIRTPEKVSWVLPNTPDADEIPLEGHWDMSHCLMDDGYLLRMRIEKRTVSAELTSLIYKAQLEELEKEKDRHLARKEKKELKEDIRIELIEQSLPNISYIDAFWDDKTGVVSLFSGSNRTQVLFEELFKKTFSEPLSALLVKIEPPLLGISTEDWTSKNETVGNIDRLMATTPVSYSMPSN